MPNTEILIDMADCLLNYLNDISAIGTCDREGRVKLDSINKTNGKTIVSVVHCKQTVNVRRESHYLSNYRNLPVVAGFCQYLPRRCYVNQTSKYQVVEEGIFTKALC